MANRSYLTVTNVKTLYPSSFDPDFDGSAQLLASDVEAIPILWLTLFRDGHMRGMEKEDEDGETFTVYGPGCSIQEALANLDDAAPKLIEMFREHGDLTEHVALFRQLIADAAANYEFITIEFQEIENLYPDHRIIEMMDKAFHGWDHPDDVHYEVESQTIMMPTQLGMQQAIAEGFNMSGFEEQLEAMKREAENAEYDDDAEDDDDDAGPLDIGGRQVIEVDFSGVEREEAVIEGFILNSHQDVLLELAQTTLDPGETYPSARMYLDNLEYSDDDQWNFTRLFGAGVFGSFGYGREVPWEKEDADYGFELRSFNVDDEDFEDDEEDDD